MNPHPGKFSGFGWKIGAVCGLLSMSAHADKSPRLLPESFHTRIVEAYSKNHCDEVRAAVKGVDLYRLRPNVMAIAARCEPEGVDTEAVFREAEKRSPTGDLILTLHAQSLWKKNPEASKEIWRKVLMLARNEYFRGMAKDYLAGIPHDEAPLNLASQTGFAKIWLGGGRKSDARPLDFIYEPKLGSSYALARGDFAWRKWFPTGSIAANASLEYQKLFAISARRYDLLDVRLDVPLAIHVAPAKDVIFRPLFGYARIGSRPYQYRYGLGLKGAVYKSEFIQSVQGIISADHFFIPELQAQQGAHYRFEYQWDFFPRLWFISSMFSVEHVSSKKALGYLGQSTGTFENSHTDFAADFQVERDFPGVTLGVLPSVSYRLDSGESQYPSRNGSGPLIIRRRADWLVTVQANAAVPVLPNLQILSWYEWKRNWSNLGPEDYIDRNSVSGIL